MPPKLKRRFTRAELLRLFAPFPLMWLVLGLTVHPAVFTFWRSGPSMSSLTAMELFCTPIGFTLFYPVFLVLARAFKAQPTWLTVACCATPAFILANVLTPLP